MENPILDFTDTLAKRELLWRAHNAGAIAAARARGLGPVFDFKPRELVEQPASQPAAMRRQRKRSLARVCEAARKAGADRVIVDGVVIALSPSAAVPESNANEWDAVLPEGDHGPH
jgi:hypothetical protein